MEGRQSLKKKCPTFENFRLEREEEKWNFKDRRELEKFSIQLRLERSDIAEEFEIGRGFAYRGNRRR